MNLVHISFWSVEMFCSAFLDLKIQVGGVTWHAPTSHYTSNKQCCPTYKSITRNLLQNALKSCCNCLMGRLFKHIFWQFVLKIIETRRLCQISCYFKTTCSHAEAIRSLFLRPQAVETIHFEVILNGGQKTALIIPGPLWKNFLLENIYMYANSGLKRYSCRSKFRWLHCSFN